MAARSAPPPRPRPGSAIVRWLRAIRNFFTGFVALMITTILFFVLLAVSSYYTVGYFIRGEEVIAPDVSGRQVTEALEMLKGRKLLLELERSEPSELIEAGVILRQRPRAGSRIKTHTTMRVVVSAGPRLVTLPPLLVGLSRPEAGIELRRLGLDVGTIATVSRADSPPDRVLACDPPVGAHVLPGTRINLLITADDSGAPRMMPDLTGQTPEQVRAAAEHYGFEAVIAYSGQSPSAEPGTVQEQSLTPGAPVARGQRVNVVIRSGF
jgi:eukaryotic-like serine/threonine-protein kinase